MRKAVLFAVAIASTSMAAQTPSAQNSAKAGVTVTGCVAPVQRDGSLGPKASGIVVAPENATMEANNPDPTGRFMLLDATPIETTTESAGAAAKKTSYALRGQEPEMAKHLGHRVQVTGTLMPPPVAKLPEKSGKTAEGIQAVQVSSVKMLGTDCSAKD